MTLTKQESVTEGVGVTDEIGVVDGVGVSFGKEQPADSSLINFLLLEDASFFLQEDGVSRFKLEAMI